MRPLIFALLIPLAACSLSQEKFAARSAEGSCELYQECGLLDSFGGSLEACTFAIQDIQDAELADPVCAYDAKAARKCLKEIKDLTCDDFEGGSDGSSTPNCDAVCGSTDDTGA